MILRLEHVENVRPERLRHLHDIRTGGVLLAARAERRARAMDLDAGLDQRVHELRCGQEVGLIGRQDVRARITPFGTLHQLVVLIHRDRALARRSHHRRPVRCRRRRGLAPRDLVLHRLNALRIHRPGIFRSLLDGVLAHLVDVEEEVLLVA